MILVILQFYNDHITFYSSYPIMLWRYLVVAFKRYVFCRPFRPMTLLTVPSMLVSIALGVDAFNAAPGKTDNDQKDKDDNQKK
jgi:hypothetical protein